MIESPPRRQFVHAPSAGPSATAKRPIMFGPPFDTIEQAFAYYTECQLATLDLWEMTKSTSKSQLERQRSIAAGMVEECRRHKLAPHRRLPRLGKLLEGANGAVG